MPSNYDIIGDCYSGCGRPVKSDIGIPEGLDLDADTCEAIKAAISEGSGTVRFSEGDVKRNASHFLKSEIEEAEEEGVFTKHVAVGDCPRCGS